MSAARRAVTFALILVPLLVTSRVRRRCRAAVLGEGPAPERCRRRRARGGTGLREARNRVHGRRAAALATGIAGSNANDSQSAAAIPSLTVDREQRQRHRRRVHAETANGVRHPFASLFAAAGGHHGHALARAPSGARPFRARPRSRSPSPNASSTISRRRTRMHEPDANLAARSTTAARASHVPTARPAVSGGSTARTARPPISIDAIVRRRSGRAAEPEQERLLVEHPRARPLPDAPDPALLRPPSGSGSNATFTHLEVRRLQAHRRQDRRRELRAVLRWYRPAAERRRPGNSKGIQGYFVQVRRPRRGLRARRTGLTAA